jgi:hypothetical protein
VRHPWRTPCVLILLPGKPPGSMHFPNTAGSLCAAPAADLRRTTNGTCLALTIRPAALGGRQTCDWHSCHRNACGHRHTTLKIAIYTFPEDERHSDHFRGKTMPTSVPPFLGNWYQDLGACRTYEADEMVVDLLKLFCGTVS